jgi:hypothetical protein
MDPLPECDVGSGAVQRRETTLDDAAAKHQTPLGPVLRQRDISPLTAEHMADQAISRRSDLPKNEGRVDGTDTTRDAARTG